MSVPRRIPPSTSTATRPSTAATTSGSTSIEAGALSSCLPPWLETITPAAPCSTASAASSPRSTPFTITGRLVEATSRSRSSHVSDGSISASKYASSPDPEPSDLI